MTLDEAIDHAREVADGCGKCADEHRQLAEWLEELKELCEGNAMTNYEKLFGTSERAARTLERLNEMSCKYCLLHDYCGDSCLLYKKNNVLLEWLKSDAE